MSFPCIVLTLLRFTILLFFLSLWQNAECWTKTEELMTTGQIPGSGGLADRCNFSELKARFPDSTDRVVSAEVFSALIVADENGYNSRFPGVYLSDWLHRNDRPIIIRDATIEGKVDLRAIRFQRAILLTNCVFTDDVYFNGAIITGSVWMDSVSIKGSLSMNSADAREEIRLQHCTVQGDAFFQSLKSQKSIVLRDNLLGTLSLDDAIIAEDLIIDRQFVRGNALGGISLTRANVARHLQITEPRGCRLISMDLARIGGYTGIQIDGNDSLRLFMNGIRAANPVSIRVADSVDWISMKGADIYQLILGFRTNPGISDNPKINRLDISRTMVNNDLTVFGLALGELTARGLTVKGESVFSESGIFSRLDLSGSSFYTLRFDTAYWPKRDSIIFSRLKYDVLPIGMNSPFWVAESSAFSADVYATLEDYYQQRGETELADEVYIALEDRQTSRSSSARWIRLKLWRLFGYGRHPEWALLWSLPFIIAGGLIFSKNRMIPLKEEGDKFKYSSLAFTIEQFLPIVNWRLSDTWAPKQEHRFTTWYERLLRLMGWVIVTILVAYLVGLIGN